MSRTPRTEARAHAIHLRPAVLGAVVLIGLAAALGLTRALAQSAEGYDARPRRGVPHRIARVDSLSAPEALSFDPAQNVYFVSNVNGAPGVRDGNGFISRINSDGRVDSLHFIQGGRGGVVREGAYLH